MTRLPNFLIIGAMKAGTSSLWHYLRVHPQVFMPDLKEPEFFVAQTNWKRGWDWYESLFQPAGPRVKAIGEASTSYTKYPVFSGVAERISSHLPRARLIYLVRDPIERIRSMYVHMVQREHEARSLAETLEDLEDNLYVQLSMYHFQISHYLRYFPQNRILIITSEDLRRRRREVMRQVFSFLGVDALFESPQFNLELNRGMTGVPARRSPNQFLHLPYHDSMVSGLPSPIREVYLRVTTSPVLKPALTPDLRERLREVLEPDVRRLRQLTGRRLQDWSV